MSTYFQIVKQDGQIRFLKVDLSENGLLDTFHYVDQALIRVIAKKVAVSQIGVSVWCQASG